MKTINYITILTISMLTALFSSCIKEDRSDCPPDVIEEDKSQKVYFTYESSRSLSSGLSDINLDCIDLFIFDENGKFVIKYDDVPESLDDTYHIPLNLEAGKYTLVSWGNLKDCYKVTPEPMIPGVTTIKEAVLHLDFDDDNIYSKPHDLYHGQITEIIVLDKGHEVFVVPLIKNTYNIHVTIIGLEYLPTDLYCLRITDSNGKYYFDNSYAEMDELDYFDYFELDEKNNLVAMLTILRIDRDRNPLINIYNSTTDTSLLTESLVDLLILMEETIGLTVDFTSIYDYYIVLRYDPKTGKFKLSVNGWDLIEDDEQIKP